MVTKDMVNAAKRFLAENPDIKQDLKEALTFVSLQPIMDMTEQDAKNYKRNVKLFELSIKYDWYNAYIPSGTQRIRCYIFGVYPNYIDEAKIITMDTAQKLAAELNAAGFPNVRLIGPDTECLRQGLKVEVVLEISNPDRPKLEALVNGLRKKNKTTKEIYQLLDLYEKRMNGGN